MLLFGIVPTELVLGGLVFLTTAGSSQAERGVVVSEEGNTL
jgi:hypothetical protein